jgi:hypothetical protein
MFCPLRSGGKKPLDFATPFDLLRHSGGEVEDASWSKVKMKLTLKV